MTNSTNTDQNTNSLDKQKANTLWKILEPYKDKYLQVWWYGGMEKGKKPGDQPQVHVLFREVLEDFSPTNNFFQITANITDLVSWRVDTVWHQQRKVKSLNDDAYEFVINHTDFEFKFLKIYKDVSKTKTSIFLKTEKNIRRKIFKKKTQKEKIAFHLK